jgi:hypothetical protein
MRLLFEALAVGVGFFVVWVSMAVVGLACDGSEPCSNYAVLVGVLGWAGLVGVVASITLLRRRWLAAAAPVVFVTLAAYVAWIVIFALGISEGPPPPRPDARGLERVAQPLPRPFKDRRLHLPNIHPHNTAEQPSTRGTRPSASG